MHIRRPCLAIALWTLIGARPAASQAQTSLGVASIARGAPNGPSVAAVSAGAPIVVGASKGNETQITIEGWVDGTRLGGGKDSYPASVNGKRALRMRGTPSKLGKVVAELHAGVGLSTVERKGTWTKVKRTVWIPSSVLGKSAATVAAPRRAEPPAPLVAPPTPSVAAPAPSVTPPTPPAPSLPTNAPAGSMRPAKTARLFVAPSGAASADLGAMAVLEPLARDRGWVKVRMEGWVNERDLIAIDSVPALTAADLHADPEGTKGRTVRWEVQVLSLQTADPLRHELARDEPYLLARGPGSENALLYLAVPPSLATLAASLPPLTTVIINAKVRSGRSEPSGAPILDLKSITKR
jgi:hypothetical protein